MNATITTQTSESQTNNLRSADQVRPGLRLVVPAPPAACPAGGEDISIEYPTRDVTVTSPFTVSGTGAAFEQTLVVRVLDATGYEVGLGNAMIDGPLGEISMYTGTISFTVPATTQSGRVQVYGISPSDGAIEHLTSVIVTLAGSGLDSMIKQVKAAIEAKDYETLASSMADPWELALYRLEGLSLSADKALRGLQDLFLGPGKVFVDLSVNGRKLLGDKVVFSPNVTHVIYSTGWGPDQADDALLLFETDDADQAQWGGLLYIFDALKDYQ